MAVGVQQDYTVLWRMSAHNTGGRGLQKPTVVDGSVDKYRI